MEKTITNGSFGKRLVEIRKQRALSQRKLAAMIGTSHRVIAYYETQTKYPPTHLLGPLAEALEVSADELLGRKPLKHEIPSTELALWRRFKKVQTLSVRQQKTVFSLLHALIARQNQQEK